MDALIGLRTDLFSNYMKPGHFLQQTWAMVLQGARYASIGVVKGLRPRSESTKEVVELNVTSLSRPSPSPNRQAAASEDAS